jgi:hypothetical protein
MPPRLLEEMLVFKIHSVNAHCGMNRPLSLLHRNATAHRVRHCLRPAIMLPLDMMYMVRKGGNHAALVRRT